MKTEEFFDERSDKSEIKARIVGKYFYAWAKVIMPRARKSGGKIAYIDLFAGPGRYRDGSDSTPLFVLKTAIDDDRISQMLVSYFNDVSNENTATLQDEINKLPGIEKLKHKPIVTCEEVDGEFAKQLNEITLIPSFSFIDPFGYKNLTSDLIKGLIKDRGCDCVFFFNYNRINAAIENASVAQHMNDLFGKERAEALRKQLSERPDSELRRAAILGELTNATKSFGGSYTLPFIFKNATGSRTLHMLVSKHFRGYSIMKDIMAKESSTDDEGVPSFTYSPADASTPPLFSLNQPLSKLKESLPATFAGRRVSLDEIYREHSVDKLYIKKNYTEAA